MEHEPQKNQKALKAPKAQKDHESYFSTHSEATSLTLDDAVETLSHLAELPLEETPESENSDSTVTELSLTPSTQLFTDLSDRSIKIIKNSFRTVLQYLKNFYKDRTNYMLSEEDLLSTRTIMLLVGEAAKRVDRQLQRLYGSHAESVTSWSEYHKLQEFYQHRIAQRIDENMLGKWILQLGVFEDIKAEGEDKKPRAKKRRFIDLESVKNDTEYELFYMRQEDGTRYHNPRLLRALRLVCDFGDYFGATHPDDRLQHVSQWRNYFYCQAAKRTIHSAKNAIVRYLREAARFKDKELVHSMNQAIIALFLASSEEHRKRAPVPVDTTDTIAAAPNKQCMDYFLDFQSFFRSAIHSYDYQKLLTYPPKAGNKAAVAMLHVVQRIAYALYFDPANYRFLAAPLSGVVQKEQKEQKEEKKREHDEHNQVKYDQEQYWKELSYEYGHLNKELKSHPNFPLEKLLSGLEDGLYDQFDPWMQCNIPTAWYKLAIGEARIHHVRLACPTHQAHIQKRRLMRNTEKRCMLFSLPLPRKKDIFSLTYKIAQRGTNTRAVRH